MKKIVSIFILIGLLALVVFLLKDDFQKARPTLYYNGDIITLNEEQGRADAMLVVNGMIENIGVQTDIDISHIDDLQLYDLSGATVMPGFIDVHTHFGLSMFLKEMYDLSGFRHSSDREVWQYFEEVCQGSATDDWLVFKSLDPILVPDLQPPTIAYLDRIAPDNPVLIFSQSLHSYWANSKAFERVGITSAVTNPSDHSYYERSEDGGFTGLIVEQEALRPFVQKLTEEKLTAAVLTNASQDVMSEYAHNGNTTIVSTGLTIDSKKSLLLLEHLSGERSTLIGALLSRIGKLPIRQQNPRHFIYMRHDMAHLMPEQRDTSDAFYNIIGIKHWYDGSPYIGTMYLDEPYAVSELSVDWLHISEGPRGEALIDKEALKRFISDFHRDGWQIAIHTQGDAAIREVVDVYEELEGSLDYRRSRHRLEHCLMLQEDELDRLKRLHLTPSFHINHILYYGDALYSDLLGEARTDAILPMQTALQSGVTPTLHADQPMFDSRPLRLIQTSMERKTKSGQVIGADERIGLLDAIRAVTINAAWQIGMENKIGSLEKGKYADFIILDHDPFEVSASELAEINCLETFINGNKVLR